MVARLTPDQKAACSNHVGVSVGFFFIYSSHPEKYGVSSEFLLFVQFSFRFQLLFVVFLFLITLRAGVYPSLVR